MGVVAACSLQEWGQAQRCAGDFCHLIDGQGAEGVCDFSSFALFAAAVAGENRRSLGKRFAL
jgi:hypothetical protein